MLQESRGQGTGEILIPRNYRNDEKLIPERTARRIQDSLLQVGMVSQDNDAQSRSNWKSKAGILYCALNALPGEPTPGSHTEGELSSKV